MHGNPADILARGQAAAGAMMTIELEAFAPGTVLDDNNREIPGGISQGTTCGRFAGPSAASRDAATRTFVVGGVPRPVLAEGLHIPVDEFIVDDVLAIQVGDRGKGWEFVVRKVGRGADRALMNRRFLVVGLPAKSFATARRLDVVEV